MTLKELQEMIKEEFDALQMEADDVDVSVSNDDIDATGGDDSEDILRKIYDMLKDKFEAEEDSMDEDIYEEENMEEEMVDEVKTMIKKTKQLIWKKEHHKALEIQELKIHQEKTQDTHQLNPLKVMVNYTKV